MLHALANAICLWIIFMVLLTIGAVIVELVRQ